MIYLNQAATTWPKPSSVSLAISQALSGVPASALRSSLSPDHDVAAQLRGVLARLLHISYSDRVFFCSGATDALNRLIGGLGDVRFAALADNHNSVLRPLFNRSAAVPVILNKVSQVAQLEGVDWLVLPHCSNVTGTVYDIAALCRMAHARGIRVMVDAAQSAGCLPVDVEGWAIDALAFTGHKALYGPQGTGGYYISPDVPLRPTVFGGTGRDSSILHYDDRDWEYEPGTPNCPGLAGLLAGVRYVEQQGQERVCSQLHTLLSCLVNSLSKLPRIMLYRAEEGEQGPLVSFTVEGLRPADVGYILQNAYGITVRTGLHCAPLCHRQLGTYPDGTVRVSLSTFNTSDDIAALVSALREIISNL